MEDLALYNDIGRDKLMLSGRDVRTDGRLRKDAVGPAGIPSQRL